MRHIELIRELTQAGGIAGFESRVTDIIEKHMNGFAEVSYDNMGSIICEKRGGGASKVMLPAHIDEVGFMVGTVTKEGFVKFYPIGGWWNHVLLSQKVIIQTKNGDIKGILTGAKPPHILEEKDRNRLYIAKEMYIDIGAASKENALEMGVHPGDPIIPDTTFEFLANDMVLAKALDDRIGCALFVDLIQALKNIDHPNNVYGVGTSQEEVGLRGATTSANIINPDICIALEVFVPTDTPGMDNENWECKLGGGPVLGLADSSVIGNRFLRDFIIETAKKEDIELQFCFLFGGGTDAGVIQKTGPGVPSVVMGVPTRYIHTHYSMFNYNDYEKTLKLLVAIIKNLDDDSVRMIKRGN